MLSDIEFSTEEVAIVSGVVAALIGAITFLFHLVYGLLRDDRDSWKQMAGEAISNLEKATNRMRTLTGRKPFEPVVAVVPEHSSPASKRQNETAELQTMRARLVAATLDLGLEPREAE